MGTFRVACEIANIVDRSLHFRIPAVLVDTGSEYTWAPRAEMERLGIQREKKDLVFHQN